MSKKAKPLSGMTGFARSEGALGGFRWTWEARSVNGKGLEARFRFPQGFDRLEPAAREIAKTHFTRGNINATLSLSREGESRIAVNTAQIDAYLAAAEPYWRRGKADIPRFDGLLSLPGVLERDEALPDTEAEKLDAALLGGLETLLSDLRKARDKEGEKLAILLAAHVDEVEMLTADARKLDALAPDAIRERVKARFDELLPEGLPEERLAHEAAALAVKADVREELDRLDVHIASARELMAGGSPAGRKLDFLAQEFNRESNTLCSKSADSALTKIGLAMKAAIDQFREQVQNVE